MLQHCTKIFTSREFIIDYAVENVDYKHVGMRKKREEKELLIMLWRIFIIISMLEMFLFVFPCCSLREE